ncbi:MAG: PDDEXK nuclease domain-containing protein [Bacteroidales bacterium]|nr:PDDEXK nuclease domain-containing protein [Bacteroidales bacterium]
MEENNGKLVSQASVAPELALFNDVCGIIDNVRGEIALYANTKICLTKWEVGRRIKEDVLFNKRAEYGGQIIKKIAQKLTERYGTGWSYKQLQHCLRAAETFTRDEIVYATRIQLTWTHIKQIMYVKDPLARQFYIEMCQIEHWDTRTLDDKIDGMLYERTSISRRPEETIKKELAEVSRTKTLVPDFVFRSDYFLDMLGLPDVFSESDLENAIVNQMELVIKELGGSDFALLDRQKRIVVDAVTYKADLVFFHRSLRRTIVVDLKLGKFKPEYEGQMRLYLRYINKHERHEWEESPIGLILCSEGNTEHIEYLMLDDYSPIKVAQYYTQLPDKKLLGEKLQRAIAIAKEYHHDHKKD